MSWKRKKLRKGRNTHYSLSKKLRQEKRSNDEFETMLSSLTLEEVIGLKLELANRAAGGYLYGLPIWHAIPDIVRDAVLKFASTATKTKGEAARYLGLNIQQFNQANKKYKIRHYFREDERLP